MKKIYVIAYGLLFATHTAFATALPEDDRFDLLYFSDVADGSPAEYATEERAIIEKRVSVYVEEGANAIADCIMHSSLRYGVDPLLATALFEQESKFQTHARSPSGAVGIAQLMPSTAAALGVNPNEVVENIDGGICYLSKMLQKFAWAGGMAETYAIAAYNAGSGAVQQYGDVPPYMETRNHVSQIARNYDELLSEIPKR